MSAEQDPTSTVPVGNGASSTPSSASVDHSVLKLNFSGKIIDHLGIQMYQSPVAAIAEMVSNAWDAEAESVNILLPETIGPGAYFQILDDGNGMTFAECQERFLTVGRNRRTKPDEVTANKGRAVLGRKGIGKFAGFGIAKIVQIATISKQNGEKTVFQLDIDALRGDQYVEMGGVVEALEYLPPDESRKAQHSTVVTLTLLNLTRAPNEKQFSTSMARRFALRTENQDFKVTVNGEPLQPAESVADVEMLFPRDYSPEKIAEHKIQIEDDWAVEDIPGNQTIRWKVAFYIKPIAEEDLRGIAVYAHGKLAQKPFEFQVVGASGQHGLEYLSGRVQADFIDEFPNDLISTERQRINWEAAESSPLMSWGQARVRELLYLWREKRGARKVALILAKLAPFSARLARMSPHEKRPVETALRKLAAIPTLSDDEFISLGESLVLAWEGGRLKELIDSIGQSVTMDESELMKILVEAKVLTSLHTAEAVKARIDLIAGLNERIQKRQLENAVRDYIAEN